LAAHRFQLGVVLEEDAYRALVELLTQALGRVQPEPFQADEKQAVDDTTPAEKLLVNEREAARLLGVCAKSVWSRTFPRGTLRSVRIGSRVLYSVETLRAWVAEQEAAHAAADESAGGAGSEVSHEESA
jgi:hypothetical protein